MPLFFALISLGFLTPSPALAQDISPLAYSSTTAPVIIEAYAAHYGIPAEPLVATLYCESHFNSVSVGDFGSSFGIAQIHLPAHPDISKTEALNPFFAINFAAYQFSIGNAKIWSCYRQLYPQGVSDG